MSGRIILAAAMSGILVLGVSPLHAAEPTEKTMYFVLLQNDLQRAESEIAAARKNKSPDFPVGYYQLEIKQLRQQIADAKKVIDNGKEFGQAEYLTAVKDRAKAHEDKATLDLKKADRSVKQASAEATTERPADINKSGRDYGAVTAQSANPQTVVLNSDELRQKFAAANGELRLVIWNLPLDGSIGKRTTRIVNVALLAEKKVVWRQMNVTLDRKQASTDISLPAVPFDEVAVEIEKWSGDGGGLAEIEVFVGRENLALHRPCRVSNGEPQAPQEGALDAVTDGVTKPTDSVGYWLPEEKKKAMVRINLLGPAASSATDAAQAPTTPATVR